MALDLTRVDRISARVDTRANRIKSLVHIRKQECGAYERLGVQPGTLIAMAAGPDLGVEGTVSPAHLRPGNGGHYSTSEDDGEIAESKFEVQQLPTIMNREKKLAGTGPIYALY